jgi:hypothetical protein
MSRKSRHLSHILMLLGILFATLLFATSIFIPKRNNHVPVSQPSAQIGDSSNTQNPAVKDPTPQDVPIDISSWKTYKDPTYRFTIKYPAEWIDPKVQKINNPDYEYEYEADFGTKETLNGSGFEGFSIFIFPTEKCLAVNSKGNSAENTPAIISQVCSTQKTKISKGADQSDGIIEFSTIAYTYTIVPYIPDSGSDLQLIKKASLEFSEAEKTFSYDSNLKIIKPATQKTAAPPKLPTPIGKRGKLTGAVSSGGRLVCPHPNRKPMKSPNQGNHVDEDCCPDPDEWPNIACSYKSSDYKIMLKVK